MKFLNAVLCFCGVMGFATVARPAEVVINEIMFHALTHLPGDDWLELHNTGSTPTNLTGWQITRGVGFTFNNAIIPAGGYLVVAADVGRFNARYPAITNVVGGWVGTLSNTREEIELSNAGGDRVDLVPYADEGDWAVRQRGPQFSTPPGWDWLKETDGLGKSIELINAALPNQYGPNWAAS
ncbi:MAG TPA: lamin tail domain-containing protein, partial [Verrucomicrobiae bacterium]|nr:lamin tail domain-containing protein [Verrucomicrobiae bacterium]